MVNWMKLFRWESVLAALSVYPNSIDPNVSFLSGIFISIQRHHTAREWVISLNRPALRQFVVYPTWVKSAGYVPYGYCCSACSVYCAAASGFVDSQFTDNRFLSGSDFWHDSGDIAGCDDQKNKWYEGVATQGSASIGTFRAFIITVILSTFINSILHSAYYHIEATIMLPFRYLMGDMFGAILVFGTVMVFRRSILKFIMGRVHG